MRPPSENTSATQCRRSVGRSIRYSIHWHRHTYPTDWLSFIKTYQNARSTIYNLAHTPWRRQKVQRSLVTCSDSETSHSITGTKRWGVFTTHTHVYGHFFGTTRVSLYQKGKTNLDFTEARDSEWQWHQLGHMQFCTSLQTDNHASTPPLSFLQAGCPSCCPNNSVNALNARLAHTLYSI